ncbi:hypothetical protein K474DRAFT_26596 [Panus rudis PR-1116 ss-1]|nr:hypothetical protein K474DRAFT_26596 [Panus rudis PR-1116 ss-1]
MIRLDQAGEFCNGTRTAGQKKNNATQQRPGSPRKFSVLATGQSWNTYTRTTSRPIGRSLRNFMEATYLLHACRARNACGHGYLEHRQVGCQV